MPLNETDKAWIRQEIQAAHRRKGLDKFTGFIKDWSGASAAIAILLFALTQWGAYVEFRTITKDKLDGIAESLKDIKGELAKLQIRAQASLPINEFQTSLSGLKSALSTAQKEKQSVAPTILNAIQRSLIDVKDREVPDFWPAVAEFISYRSFNNTSWSAPTNLLACTDSEPAPSTVSILSPKQATINPGVYENCRFTLDSPQENTRLNEIIKKRMAVVVFKHCVIVYRGGPINLVFGFDKYNVPWSTEQQGQHFGGTVNISVRDAVRFQDCLFDFVLRNEPPKDGQKLTQLLLVNSSNEITVPLSTLSDPPPS